jgi:glutaredoxin
MSQDVVVYALSTCPWCKRAKEWFAAQQVACEFIDIDRLPDAESDAAADKARELSGSHAFPVVVIGGSVVVGYRPERYADLLGIK